MGRIGHRWVVVAALAVTGISGCSSGATEVGAGGTGEWQVHSYGEAASDQLLLGVPFAGGAAVVTVDARGAVAAHLLAADGEVTEAAVAATPGDDDPSTTRHVTALVDGPVGLLAFAQDLPRYRNVVLRSIDGLTWTEAALAGVDDPLDVYGAVATDEHYVAFGAFRTGPDLSLGPFAPALLTSADGLAWGKAEVPAGAGSVVSVVALDGRLLAAATDEGGEGELWASTDGGRSWDRIEGAPPATLLAARGNTVVAAERGDGLDGGARLQRSEDGGRTWELVPATFTAGHDVWTLVDGGTGFALEASEVYPDPLSDPERCYATPTRCGPRQAGDGDVVFLSDDGVAWRRLDLASLPGRPDVTGMVGDRSGATVVLGTRSDGRWGTWRWPAANGPLPEGPAPADPPAYDGPPLVAYGGDLEPGTTYAYALYFHCGFDLLGELDGRLWGLDGTVGRNAAGQLPAHWPVVSQSVLGYLTLVADERIEYSLADGEVIATYRPLPPGTEAPPCG